MKFTHLATATGRARRTGRADGASGVWRRRSGIIVAGGLALGAGAVVAGAYLVDSGAAPDERDTGSRDVVPTASGLAPSDPPAQICDNASVLDGPPSPPAGAVRVGTSENLNAVTQEHPAGSTFWLSPGVHTLGDEPFSQVIPKDGNIYLGASGAILDGQRLNQYAFGGQATGVTITHLTVQNFGPRGTNNNEGVVNHDSAADWVVEYSTIWKNAGAGVMVGSGNVISDNCLAQNGQYGFSAYHPDKVADITIARNEIAGNNVDDWETVRPGCGCTGGGKFWEVTGAAVRDNWVHDNLGVGLWADTNNVGFAFEGNYFSGNEAEGILYETSYNAVISGNAFVRNGLVKGPTNPGFPTSAIYISESGSDDRVASDYNETFEISDNVFTDNWAGVILWENADRFAGSPANTSTGAGTLVNPGVVTADTCNAANIRTEPYIHDCRWKTVNVHVHHNQFSLDPDEIGETCASQSGCGFNGLFANWGTFPDWSPYHESVVQEAVTFEQDNRFYSNIYTGPWQFVVHEQGKHVDWASWQGAPYGQDRDSVIKVRTPGER
jgi:hypothetical protein